MTRNGFTLVELMVVMTLVALAGAAVIMTIGNRDGGAADAASRFASRLGAARDEAILGGRPVGVWVTASGYGFERLSDRRWMPVEDAPLAGADWPQGVRVSAIGGSAPQRAQIRFDPLGLPVGTAVVQLADGGRTMEVRVDSSGDVVIR